MRFIRPAVSTMTLVTITALVPSALAAAPLQILWDDTHDTDLEPGDELTCAAFCGGSYTLFAAAVTAAGHSITELDDLDGLPGDLTAGLLAGYDVLMLFDVEEAYTADEIAAIQSFVTDGGSVLITGEQPPTGINFPSHNDLLLPYGLQFTNDAIFAPIDLTHFETDPLTAGILSLDFAAAGVLSVDGSVAGTKVLGRTVAGGFIGFAYGAAGHVVVLSDSNLFSDSFFAPTDLNERQLLANLLAHFMALQGGGGPLTIDIDIKPRSTSNPIDPDEEPDPINPKSRGVIPVAILSTDDFDPWDDELDVTTLVLGPGAASIVDIQGEAFDVDGDGDLDMLVHFGTQESGVACGMTELTLTGETFDGQAVTATEPITTPGCK